MAAYALPAALACVMTVCAQHGFAQQLRDPTRPPAMLAPTGGETKQPDSNSGLVLQTILISPSRRSAIVDGRLLTVGQSVSGFKVVSIEEGVVTLKGPQGTRRLQMFPAVEMRKSLTVRPDLSQPPAPQGSATPSGTVQKREEG